MTELVLYDRACAALAAARTEDEVKHGPSDCADGLRTASEEPGS